MDIRLELVIVPVTDVDRAKRFYAEQCGFHVDVDATPSPTMRVVQLTPPGSACSITIGTGMDLMTPGSLKGVQLCVADIQAAHALFSSRGVPVTTVRHLGPGGWEDDKGEDWNAYFFFDDPDGNSWAVQESPVMRAAAAGG